MRRVEFVSVLLGCVLILASTVAGRRSQPNEEAELFKRWVEEARPDLAETLEKKAEQAAQKAKADKYFDRSLSIFDIIRMFMVDHGPAVNAKMESLFRKYQSAPPPSGNNALECQNTQQCPPAVPNGSKKRIVDKWRQFSESIRNQPDSCVPCQSLIGSLQESACEQPWETMRDDLINLCENLLFPLIDLDPVMCNGTVTLQGQHLYCIAKEVSPFEFCESMNMCYPASKSDRRPVSERTPWAVKDKLQPKLQKQLARRQRMRRVRRQSDVVRVVQLTDIHMQPKYAIGAPSDCKAAICCLDNSIPRDGTGYARRWGEYTCNVPESTMHKFLAKVNDFNPDFVLYAGDSPPHTLWDETQTSQLNCSNIVVNAMKNNFPPGLRVYPNIGNHEMYPTNLYSARLTETVEMNQVFTQMWHGLAGLDAQANATFSDMSYYTILHQPGLRILSINTNYDWYTTNFYNTLNRNDTSNANHMAFVETTLANARANNEKVVIVGHHPIHSAVVRTIRWWQDLMIAYNDVIVLHVSGHTHSDELDLTINPTLDEAVAVNLVSPTVTTNTNVNPSLRVFDLDSTTFELLESECHFFDLQDQVPDEDPAIVLNYNTKTEYNMTDLSPAAFQDLIFRFIDDEALFQRYYANRNAMAPRGPCLLDNICGQSCKIGQICGMWFPDPEESAACEEAMNNGTLAAAPVHYSGVTSSHSATWWAVVSAALLVSFS